MVSPERGTGLNEHEIAAAVARFAGEEEEETRRELDVVGKPLLVGASAAVAAAELKKKSNKKLREIRWTVCQNESEIIETSVVGDIVSQWFLSETWQSSWPFV